MGNMDVCTKLNGNPSDGQDLLIRFRDKTISLTVALEEKLNLETNRIHPLETMIYVISQSCLLPLPPSCFQVVLFSVSLLQGQLEHFSFPQRHEFIRSFSLH